VINDLPDSVKGKVSLFADDTIVYLTIKSTQDAQTLQNDLNNLENWESDWSMEFNPDKCEVFSISRKKHQVTFPYNLHCRQLKSTEAAKYLGVKISKDLSWTNHINNITAKAHNSLRFIKRNVKTSSKGQRNCLQNLCKAPVRILFHGLASLANISGLHNRTSLKVSCQICTCIH
jgi:hypothetical protein